MVDKLTPEHWIAHGFDVLRQEGHEGLKADRMAKTLGISRGSFYWHFPSLSDFHTALLQAWSEQITQTVIAELQTLPDGQQQLEELITRSIQTPQDIEIAMRRWGGVDPAVASALRAVDQLRVEYLTGMFSAAGIPLQAAKSRAILMTWAFIGRAFAPSFVAELAGSTAAELSDLMLNAPQKRL
jgi:AcrR family transcriptional regulator